MTNIAVLLFVIFGTIIIFGAFVYVENWVEEKREVYKRNTMYRGHKRK